MRKRLYIADANVLIDYALSDPSILGLAVECLGAIKVPRDVFEEVEDLSDAEAVGLGIEIVDPEPAELMAAAKRRGGLSRQDRLCLAMAKSRGGIVVTNDKALLGVCQQEDVRAIRGLRLMITLVEQGQLSKRRAQDAARHIARVNPQFARKVIEDFESILDSLP